MRRSVWALGVRDRAPHKAGGRLAALMRPLQTHRGHDPRGVLFRMSSQGFGALHVPP